MAKLSRRSLLRGAGHLTYENTGHTIAPPFIPATVDRFVHPVSKDAMALGGMTEGRAHANADWWPKALAFLTRAAAGT